MLDNDHRVYWKQRDCIRIHITNNPFRFTCNVSVDETKLPEDDLSKVLTGVGVNVSTSNNTDNNPDTKTADATASQKASAQTTQKSVPKLSDDMQKLDAYYATPAGKNSSIDIPAVRGILSQMITAGSKGDLKSMQKAASGIDQATQAKPKGAAEGKGSQAKGKPAEDAAVQPVIADIKAKLPNKPSAQQIQEWQSTVASLTQDSDFIGKVLRLMKSEYDRFATGVPGQVSRLIDQDTPLKDVKDDVTKLDAEAKTELKCLTNGILNSAKNGISNCPGSADSTSDGVTIEERLLSFANRGTTLHKAIENYVNSPDDQTTSAVGAIFDELHASGEKVAYVVCAVQGMRDSDLSSISKGLITPLDAVLNDPVAFGYDYPAVAKKREGPWTDPESATMTMTRDKVSPFAATSSDGTTPANTTSSFNCSNDTSDMLENGDTYISFADFFTDKPVKNQTNTYHHNQNNPVNSTKAGTQTATKTGTTNSGGGSTSGNPSTPTKPAQSVSNNTVLVQPWIFGRARLVLTGGITSGFLSEQEYQRSTNSSGATVVGLKTDQRERLTPMLYGHVLLPRYARHDSDAWYGTLGVTAKSDNQSTDPEFLIGISRSVAQQRFFLTAGAYVGEKQTLDGGWQVGQTIPSSFTGELPVTKGYHVGWGFGISYRFTSTKDPQKDGSKKTAGSSTKKSN